MRTQIRRGLLAAAVLAALPSRAVLAEAREEVIVTAKRLEESIPDLDAVTGKLVNLVDADARSYRWLHYGLHRLDFQWLRAWPLWDGVMLVLLVR